MVLKYLFKRTGSNIALARKSKGLLEEGIKPSATSDNSHAPIVTFINTKIRVKLDGSCLQQDKVSLNHECVMNLYIGYK